MDKIIWVISYLTVLGVLSVFGLHRYLIVYLYLKHRRDIPVPLSTFDPLPPVTVQLPVFNEVNVVERLLESVARLDYPIHLLQIQVLDDSTDDTRSLAAAKVDELKSAGFDIELIHRSNREGFKAGALSNGMKTCRNDLILILDADFLPEPDLLQKTVHFFSDPKIGMIQTRWGHLNRNASILTRLQAMFLDGHLLLEQTARSRSGRFINFNGTAGLWRKSCIETAGGWEHDTLTEDLDLSYRAQLKGWKFVFLKDLVTPAELPVDIAGFKSQQHRWTKGSIQTCKKILPAVWRSNFPLYVKIESTIHLTSNFGYLLLLCLCVLMRPAGDPLGGGIWRFLLLDLPILFAATVSASVFYFLAQYFQTPKDWWKHLVLVPALLALAIGMAINNGRAVLEALLNHTSGFVRTPKYGVVQNSSAAPVKKYSAAKMMSPVLELAFALYFSIFVIQAAITLNAFALPFLLLFQLGFGSVALASFWPSIMLLTGSDRGEVDTEQASLEAC